MCLLAPTGLSVIDTSFTSIIVRWNPLPNSDGPDSLLGFRIRYAKTGSDDYTSIDIKSSQIQTVITNLEGSTTYKIQVAGLYTKGRIGPYSIQIEVMTSNPSSKFFIDN